MQKLEQSTAELFKNTIFIRTGGFEFGLQNPLEGLNLTLFSQDVQDLLEALRFPLPLQLNASGEILNFENLTRLNGTFDKVKVY